MDTPYWSGKMSGQWFRLWHTLCSHGQKCPGLSIPSVAFHDGSRKNLWFSPISGKSVKIVTKYCRRSERPLFNSVPFWDSVTFRYWVGVCFTEKSVKGFRGFFHETTVHTCGHDCCASGAQLLNSIAFCYRNPKMGLHLNPNDKTSLSFGQKCPKVFYSFLSKRATAFQGNVIWNHRTSTRSFLSRFNRCDFKSHLSINRFYTFNPVIFDRVQLVRFQITPNVRNSSISRNSSLRF